MEQSEPGKEPWEEEYHQPVRLEGSLRQQALRQVKAPANALFSAGIMTCVACTLFIIVRGVMFWFTMRQNRDFQGRIAMSNPIMGQFEEMQYVLLAVGMLVEIIGIGLGIVVILGSRKMKQLIAYRFAMTSSILSIMMAFPLGLAVVHMLSFGNILRHVVGRGRHLVDYRALQTGSERRV